MGGRRGPASEVESNDIIIILENDSERKCIREGREKRYHVKGRSKNKEGKIMQCLGCHLFGLDGNTTLSA